MSQSIVPKISSVRKFRLSLLQKLLLFILVPIVLEIVFLVGALWLFHQAEMEVKQEARINAVSTLVEQLIHSLYGAGSDIMTSATLGPKVGEESFRKHTQRTVDCIVSLREVTATDPEERAVVEKLAESCKKSLTILKESHDAVGEGPHGLMFIKGHRLARQFEKLIRDTLDQVALLKELEETRKKKLPLSKAQTKYQLQALLWVSTGFNVILGIFLALFLTRSLTSRLSVMLENTSRVASGQKLLPPFGGDDELSQLDSSMHEAAELLRQAERKQVELEESRKQFVAMIGHDLKNPLQFIQLSLSSLHEEQVSPGSPQGRKLIGQCTEEIQRLVNLTNDLILAARTDAQDFELKREPTKVWTLFERAASTVQSLAENRQVTIETDSCEEVLNVDRDRMIQVFVNLLSNAVQASDAGSLVRLQASIAADEIFLDVVDQGGGIPEVELKRVFERFYRVAAENKREGCGLGLAICHAIVTAHSGSISACNLPEGGCRFRIALPLAAVGILTMETT